MKLSGSLFAEGVITWDFELRRLMNDTRFEDAT